MAGFLKSPLSPRPPPVSPPPSPARTPRSPACRARTPAAASAGPAAFRRARCSAPAAQARPPAAASQPLLTPLQPPAPPRHLGRLRDRTGDTASSGSAARHGRAAWSRCRTSHGSAVPATASRLSRSRRRLGLDRGQFGGDVGNAIKIGHRAQRRLARQQPGVEQRRQRRRILLHLQRGGRVSALPHQRDLPRRIQHADLLPIRHQRTTLRGQHDHPQK